MSTVYTKIYDAPPVSKKEILRYAGVRETSDELLSIVDGCLSEIKDRLSYKVCYAEFDVTFFDDVIDLGFCVSASKDLRKNLSGCDRLVLFAATVGLEMDRLIARYSSVSPTKALIFDSIGAERIESLCGEFNREISERAAKMGEIVRPRFSAGYGDFSIDAQKDIFRALNCPKNIGLSLTDSLLMSPSKSVTAIIGISNGSDKE